MKNLQKLVAAAAIASVLGSRTLVAEERATDTAEQKEDIIDLSSESLKNMALDIAPLKRGSLEMPLKVAGRVSLNMNKTAQVASTLEGRITDVQVDLNQEVSKGDLLAVVESPELLGKSLQIKAPIGGIITDRQATVGEQVDKNKELFTVSNPTQLWVIGEVKERDISMLKVGQPTVFEVLSFPGKKFNGTLDLIGTQVEPDTRTLEVRIGAQNTDGLLKPGMFADLQIITKVVDNVLLVPDDALQTEGENQIAFVAIDDHRFEKRIVRVGMDQEGQAEILDGLKDGERLVTKGSFILKSELLKGELGEE